MCAFPADSRLTVLCSAAIVLDEPLTEPPKVDAHLRSFTARFEHPPYGGRPHLVFEHTKCRSAYIGAHNSSIHAQGRPRVQFSSARDRLILPAVVRLRPTVWTGESEKTCFLDKCPRACVVTREGSFRNVCNFSGSMRRFAAYSALSAQSSEACPRLQSPIRKSLNSIRNDKNHADQQDPLQSRPPIGPEVQYCDLLVLPALPWRPHIAIRTYHRPGPDIDRFAFV